MNTYKLKYTDKETAIADLNTGVFYNSIKEVAELYNIKHSTLRSRLNGTNKNNTQFICV